MIYHDNNYEAYYSAGVSRDTRTPVALLPENIPLDERGMEDDLFFAGALSDYVNFFNLENKKDGTWYPFFGRSEPALLATIATTNLDKIKKRLDYHLLLFSITNRDKNKIRELNNIFNSTLNIALLINHWYRHLALGKKNSVLQEIESLIEGRLRKGLEGLKYIEQRCAEPDALGFSFNGNYGTFGDKWTAQKDDKFDGTRLNLTEVDGLVVLLSAIRNIYDVFFHALTYIVQYTQQNLETIIGEKHDNRPDISLYIAFAKMMKQLRGQMNSITERHIDFYYFDVLRHKFLPYNPDHALVRFVLQENAKELFLPAGTALVAGKDDMGKELLYTTDKDFYVNQARVAALRTLFVSRNENVKVGVENDAVRMVKAIFSSENPAASLNGNPLDWWPLMGCDQLNVAPSQTLMKEAEIGFSITSPVLFLSEGLREITVTFNLDNTERPVKPSSDSDAVDTDSLPNTETVPETEPKAETEIPVKTESPLKALRKIIQEVKYNQSRDDIGAIFYLFSKALSVSITSADGWKNVDRHSFTYNDETAELALRFSFTPTDPAIIGFDAALHGEGFDTPWPVLRMMLNTMDAPVFAYSLLSDVLVDRIRIKTDVKGMRKLTLYNSAGKLSTEKPFQPFGPLPMPGSYLLIGNSEAMNKNIQSVQLQFSWDELPTEGFAEYYKGYPGDITNSSFTAGISLLQDGYFLPLRNDQQKLQLFFDAQTDHPERGIPVQPETVVDEIDMSLLLHRPTWNIPKSQITFGPEARDGFLKLELLTPSIGFGSSEYAPLLSSVIIKNSKTKKPEPLPRLPYTPVLSNISLDYSAEFDSDNSITVDDGQLPIGIYRHHPFGMERVSIASSFKNVTLFPQLENEGYLFIGISGLDYPRPLSLLFKLSDESLYSHESPDAIQWSYLTGNRWKLFRDDRVIADGTKKFVQPGIVELDLPGEMTSNNTIMPSGMYWVCASVKSKTHCISYAKSIHTQGVGVTWKNADNSFSHLDSPLPAGSITKTKQKIPQIKEIVQPIPSVGGSVPEQKIEAYTRLSERLAHRNRALLPVDFERIVLQQFPTVYKVQCFPDMDSEGKHKQGNVLVVVVPDIDRRKDINIYRPKDSYSLLQEITEFLVERASPFANIEVRNPLYERVKVIAKVKFRRGLDSGLFLRRLNEDMRVFLSPWVYDSQVEVGFGGVISHSEVLGFIERQSYVEFVTGLSVVVTKDHDGIFLLEDTARIQQDEHQGEESGTLHAGKPWSILVTASRHLFTAIDSEKMEPPVVRSVDNLVIGDDFIITK
jgi:hypothetical protein